nr:protein ALP1-like [Tanacetum cinerariifolium]
MARLPLVEQRKRRIAAAMIGTYYLCDAGYTNGEGFLTPFRGQRYHLNDWSNPPTTAKELYNKKHSSARNVIERCFGLIKARRAILRDNSYHPIESMPHIIIACCLMHNFIRTKMTQDPLDCEVLIDHTQDGNEHDDVVRTVEISNEWSNQRDDLANAMVCLVVRIEAREVETVPFPCLELGSVVYQFQWGDTAKEGKWYFENRRPGSNMDPCGASTRSAKEALDLITDIFKDNKRSRTIALKTELRSIQLVKMWLPLCSKACPTSMRMFVALLHTGSLFRTLKQLDQTTEEMRLRSKSLSLPVDSSSSSPMVLISETCNSRRPSDPQIKSWRPCYNFAKGSCRFGETCKYVHDAQVKSGTNSRVNNVYGSASNGSDNTSNELLVKLLSQLGNIGLNCSPNVASNALRVTNTHAVPHNNLIAYQAGPSTYLGPSYTPPGFVPL